MSEGQTPTTTPMIAAEVVREVRKICLGEAVTVARNSGADDSPDAVLEAAKKFEAFVMGTDARGPRVVSMAEEYAPLRRASCGASLKCLASSASSSLAR